MLKKTYFMMMAVVLGIFVCSGQDVRADREAFTQTKNTIEKTRSLPKAHFEGEIKTLSGSLFGYLYPNMGDRLAFDFADVETEKEWLVFTGTGEKTSGTVPLPMPQPANHLTISDVEGAATFEKWQSFRAVAAAKMLKHKVTFDALRKPGMGDPDYVVIRILIESQGRMAGFIELHGKITKSP